MKNLFKTDPAIAKAIKAEEKRQVDELEMIPSENYVSGAVREATGSVLMNKYSEGYAGRRYYQGNKWADAVERLAVERAKKLFGVPYVNVQPYSGSPANSAVYFGLLKPGDKIMGLALAHGGHLTHGHPDITFSGKYFKTIQYEVGKDGKLDYGAIEKMAVKEKPNLIVVGTTAYPRILDFKKFSQIAGKVKAYLLADISHIAGLVVGGVHPSPVPYVDVVMTTTHKTLRGPRGAMLMVTKKGLLKDPTLAEKIDRAVFPGLQGGPHDNVTAGIAVALREAQGKPFKLYARQVVKNAKVLEVELKRYGFDLVSGGTDNHLILVDLRNKRLSGWVVAWALEYAGIILNRNSVPWDTASPFYPSGIRLGTPALTSRGMKEKEMKQVAKWIADVVEHVRGDQLPDEKEARGVFTKKFLGKIKTDKYLAKIRREVKQMAVKFPVPGITV